MDINDINSQAGGQLLNQQEQKKKKCHGNRRDQRFRRKCRARGMKPAKIEQLLNKHKQSEKNNQQQIDFIRHGIDENRLTASNEGPISTSDSSKQLTTMSTKLVKRKRNDSSYTLKSNSTIPKSISSISMKQPSLKKKKTMTHPVTTANNQLINKNYRRPMYLKRSPFTLFQMLRKRFNYALKQKHEKEFIFQRLELFDQHYCLEVDLELWQSYLELGQEKHQWPEQLSKMANTHDNDLCHRYLLNYIEDIKNQINQYQLQLTLQSELYPITYISLEKIDQFLKEYVDCQRKYLSIRNNNQMSKFSDDIMENELFEIITSNYPSINNNEFINQLITIRQKQMESWEELLQLEMRILCKFLPPHFDHLQKFLTSITYSTTGDEQQTIQLNNQHYTIIQEAKRQWLHISLSIYENKLQDYDHQYTEIFNHLEFVLANDSNIHFASVSNSIHRYMTYRTNRFKEEILHKTSAYRGKLIQHRQRSLSAKLMIGVAPEPYLDINFNPFNTLEWNHLSLGPSFIRLNQSALRSRKEQEIEIKNQHKDIYEKVELNLIRKEHIPITAPILKQYSNQLHHQIQETYFTPISYKDHLEANEQARIAASIQKKLRQFNLIMRVTDKSNNFYIGSSTEFQKKAQNYFNDTNAFQQLNTNPFKDILNRVIRLLNHLRSKKYILKMQFEEMLPDQTKTELAHLYFNPKTHKDGTPVRPIENMIHAPTTNISKFLDKIIRPIFDSKCQETTIIDGTHLIKEFQKYTRKGLFKSTTLFCTFDIHNLYTMLPQDESLNILMEFLHVHGYTKVKGVNLDTIRRLASIVLKDNVFVYNNKIYQQTMGGAMGSSFTLTLANIFMWKWQKEFVRQQNITGEFFGRYIDDILITWNRPEQQLLKLLNDANKWHPHIKLDYKISKSLPFLNVLLTNNNGTLNTSVYHKPTAQPYVIPFRSDHPRHTFSNIIQTALQRAIRYSSTLELFNHERRSIKLMLLYNGYPSTFIDNQFQKFFTEYIDSYSFLPFITDEQQFFRVQHKIIDQPTPKQSQVAISAATADIDNDQTEDSAIELKQCKNKLDNDVLNSKDKLIIHYTYEKRFASLARNIHRNFENVFTNANTMTLKLIVGNRNRRDTKKELIHKRPKRSILQSKLIKKKYFKFLEQRKKAKQNLKTHTITGQQQ